MKKLLSLLGAVTLTATGVSGIVANKLYTNFQLNNWHHFLNVIGNGQEKRYYCVAASVQMILNYFNVDINVFNQDRIYNDLGGGETGIYVDNRVSDYLNNVLQNYAKVGTLHYNYNQIPNNFGNSSEEMAMFEFYVTNSLEENAPVIFGGARADKNVGHAYVIYGIDIDQNDPMNTEYYCINSRDGNRYIIHGRDIHIYTARYGGIIGVSNNFDFKNKRIKIDIKGDTHERHRLYNGDKVQIDNPKLDFASVGIMSHNQLNRANSIVFPDLTVNENWNGIEENYHGDSWNAKNITGNQSWLEWSDWEGSYEYFLARAKLWWWDSTKILEETSDHFIVAFQYYLESFTVYSTSSIDVTIDYGKIAYIQF